MNLKFSSLFLFPEVKRDLALYAKSTKVPANEFINLAVRYAMVRMNREKVSQWWKLKGRDESKIVGFRGMDHRLLDALENEHQSSPARVFNFNEIVIQCTFHQGQNARGLLKKLVDEGVLRAAYSKEVNKKCHPVRMLVWLPDETIDALPHKEALDELALLENIIVAERSNVSALVACEPAYRLKKFFGWSASAIGKLSGYEPPPARFPTKENNDKYLMHKLREVGETIYANRPALKPKEAFDFPLAASQPQMDQQQDASEESDSRSELIADSP